MGQRVKMDLRVVILRLREDRIYCGGGHIIVLDSLIFQSCHFCSRFFWVAILKSERFFSSVNRQSEKWLGSSIGVLHEAFKNRPHIYIFLTKNFYGFETVFALWLLDFSLYFICVLCRVKILPHIYTRIIASLKPPPYIRSLYAREISPRYIWEFRRIWNLCASDWLSVGILAFVCIIFVYAVIVWIRSFLLIGQLVDVKIWL